MPTLTTTATYQNRVLVPEIHPPLVPTEAVVVFIPKDQNLSNALLVFNALKKAIGVLPKNIDGVKYENNVRKFSAADWDKKIKQNNL